MIQDAYSTSATPGPEGGSPLGNHFPH